MIEPVQKDTTLMLDFVRAPAAADLLHLWWIGQSGFVVKWQENLIALDPYLSDSLTKKYAQTDKPHVRMTANVMSPWALRYAGPRAVTCSHQHTDHMDPDTLGPTMVQAQVTKLLAPEAWRGLAAERAGVSPDAVVGMDTDTTASINGVEFIGVPAAHESIERDEQGRCKYLGYVIRCGPWAIYHSGDTVLYDGMVDRLRPFGVDVALLPINGRAPERRVAGNLNGREAAWLAKEIGAKLAIPCHYEMFEFNTASPAEFVAECQRLGQPYKVLRAGERWSSADLPR